MKIINSVFILILIILVGLFIYKSIKIPEIKVVSRVDNFSYKPLDKLNLYKYIEEYIKTHYDVNIQSKLIDKTKNSNLEADNLLHNNIINVHDNILLGNLQGDIQIVIFYDYKCKFCYKAYPVISALLESDKNISVAMVPMPVVDQLSLEISKIALAVYKMSKLKFLLLHQKLVALNMINRSTFDKILTELNIDEKLISEFINDQDISNIVKNNLTLATSLGINGVPSYIINGKIFKGFVNIGKLTQIIYEIRSRINHAS
ncbi:DsbA family protein [Rickettsia endosymbiont of Cardiosporidium cionae]|uniref:DsbA family protein n=1 Tax=Rickettsia endosymbiont of Cardiosporidium cionae TaxID=2777155 RepID=UPI001895F509|nr:DsbA family protein [Rickettsia endosymbiont of Cardiosporidium cionae]KAF8818988.1 thiol:disulfide interchange protein [Rickettsia endosymbiont of Cardiosporidium cionae]